MTDLHESFDNIHAHHLRGPRIITSVEPSACLDGRYGEEWYSVGIHPWSTASAVGDATLLRLEELAADPRVVAIGEAGFDKKRGGSMHYQEEIFLIHAALAERTAKPLIIHCVGRYGRLMELHRLLKPSVEWIVHGFTGKPELARQLVAEGFSISLGTNGNSAVENIIPPSKLYRETD